MLLGVPRLITEPDDVDEEMDATWLEAGGNGNPRKRAHGTDTGAGAVSGPSSNKKFVL